RGYGPGGAARETKALFEPWCRRSSRLLRFLRFSGRGRSPALLRLGGGDRSFAALLCPSLALPPACLDLARQGTCNALLGRSVGPCSARERVGLNDRAACRPQVLRGGSLHIVFGDGQIAREL